MEMAANNPPSKNLADLQKEIERLSLEKNQYLDELSNGEILKMQLKETRNDAKHLTKKKKRLQALANTAKEEISEQPTLTSKAESHVSLKEALATPLKLRPEPQLPQGFSSMSREESLSSHSEESFPPPPPPEPFTNPLPRGPEWGVRDARALEIENRNLVAIKRKQEEQIDNLVQEFASLQTKYRELEMMAQRLKAENQRLSQRFAGQLQSYNVQPNEEIQLLRAQLKVYEDDFKKERSEKEQLNTQKERLKRELRDSQATVAGLQRQLKQALAGEGGYGEPYDPSSAPVLIERQPYYETHPARHLLNYGMARAYSGGYIGPGASNDVLRSRQTPYVKKSFLSPDLTAVIDRDVVDGTTKRAPKSI